MLVYEGPVLSSEDTLTSMFRFIHTTPNGYRRAVLLCAPVEYQPQAWELFHPGYSIKGVQRCGSFATHTENKCLDGGIGAVIPLLGAFLGAEKA